MTDRPRATPPDAPGGSFWILADEALQKRDCTLWRARGPGDRAKHGGNFAVVYGGRTVFASDDLGAVRAWLRL